MAALKQQYGKQQHPELLRTQLRSRRQKNGETLQDLAGDIERTTRLAYPEASGNTLDTIIKDAFVDAVRDPELKRYLKLSAKQKLSELLKKELKFEASKPTTFHQARSLRIGNKTEALTGIANNRRGQILPNQVCWDCGKVGHVRRNCKAPSKGAQGVRKENYQGPSEAPTKQCWNCGVVGHISRNCGRLKPQNRGTGRPVQMDRVPNHDKEGSLYVSGKLGSCYQKFLLDTGESRSVIRPALVQGHR